MLRRDFIKSMGAGAIAAVGLRAHATAKSGANLRSPIASISKMRLPLCDYGCRCRRTR
jgi:hypothetical protein